MKGSKDNIIKFPSQNVPAQEADPHASSSNNNTRVLIYGALATLFVAAVSFNFTVSLISNQEKQNRSIASIDRNVEWEHQLAEKLSKIQPRGVASVGQSPSKVETLQFGVFKGKYRFVFEEGKIKEIVFAEQPLTKDEPRYLNNRPGFLSRHGSLLSVSFEDFEQSHFETTEELRLEEYSLMRDQQKVGKVQFKMDPHGRLLSLKVSSL